MNHLEASFTGKNSAWRYLIMLLTIFAAANTIGSLPLIIKVSQVALTDPVAAAEFARSPGNPAILGIDPNTGLMMVLLPFAAGFVAFLLLIKPLHQRTFKMTVNGADSIRWNRFFLGALVWAALSAVYLFIYLKVDPWNFILNDNSEKLAGLILISLLFIPLQSGLEEVVFRGYLMQGFAVVVRKRWFPLLMTSVLFGMLHAFNPEVKEFGFFTMMPQYIVFGLIFGVITIMDDGIEAAAGAHAANNIFLSVMVTQESSALQTASVYEQIEVYPWTDFLNMLLMGALFIMIMKKLLGLDYSVLFAAIEKRSSDQRP